MIVCDGLMMIYMIVYDGSLHMKISHRDADLDNLDLCFLLLNSFGSLILLEPCMSSRQRTGKA
jgi:hypothetical protein